MKKAYHDVMRGVHGPRVYAAKSKLMRSVIDPAKTNPQGKRQDFARMEVVKKAYCDVTRGVHGP